MTDTPLPCPFCPKAERTIEAGTYSRERVFFVLCLGCGARGPFFYTETAAVAAWNRRAAPPIPMMLHCPNCAYRHIDKPEPDKKWTNPPHRSHLCERCGCIWRPADVPTVGVAALTTRGEEDTWEAGKSLATDEDVRAFNDPEQQRKIVEALEPARLTEEDVKVGPGYMFMQFDRGTWRQRAEKAEALVRDLSDNEPCWFDHHGYCQAHMWMRIEPKCPHARAKDLLKNFQLPPKDA